MNANTWHWLSTDSDLESKKIQSNDIYADTNIYAVHKNLIYQVLFTMFKVNNCTKTFYHLLRRKENILGIRNTYFSCNKLITGILIGQLGVSAAIWVVLCVKFIALLF